MSARNEKSLARIKALTIRFNALPAEDRAVKARAAAKLQVPITTLSHLMKSPEYGRGFNIPSAKELVTGKTDQERASMLDRIAELETQLKSARNSTIDDEFVQRKIVELKTNVAAVKPPSWVLRPLSGDGLPGVPSLMWSDWHWGEVVYPSQINGVNEFNLAIAHNRARRLTDTVVHLLKNHVVNPRYPGIVLNLGGDMVTGDIHEELSESNELPIMPTVVDLYGVLLHQIRVLADEFGAVFVPCVTGNHGRNTKKPRAKNRNFTNFDWLLYTFLAKAFEEDRRVNFFIPDGPDALYRVYGHRYLLTHGDQFRGGDGQIGAIGPITRGNKRKLARNSQIDRDYDTMILGHWHQYMPLHRQIVNGSLKGYDEYANSCNFEFEVPIQAMWLTHPKKGIIHHMPVYLEDRQYEEASNDWVAIPSAA